MENIEPEMGELVGDIEQLDLADFVMDDFVAKENDGSAEIEQIKEELVEMKKELESIKLASKSDSKEIGRKLDEKMDGLETYVKEQLLKLAPENQQKETSLEKQTPKKEGIDPIQQQAENLIKDLDLHFDNEEYLIDELEQKEMKNEELMKENKMLEGKLAEMGAKMEALDSGAFRELMLANKESAKLRNELGKMEEENNELKGKIQDLKDEVKIGQWEIGILEQQNKALCKEMVEFENKNWEFTNKLMEEKQKNEGNAMDEDSANKIQQKGGDRLLFDNLEMENKSLKEMMVKLEKKMFELGQKNFDLKVNNEGKDYQMQGMKGKIENLEEEIGELKKMEQMRPMKNCSGELGISIATNPFGAASHGRSFTSMSISKPTMPKGTFKQTLGGPQNSSPNMPMFCAGCEQRFDSSDWARQVGDHFYHSACFKCAHCHRQLSTGEQFGQDANVQRKHGMLGTNVPRILCKRDYMDLVVVGGTSSSGTGIEGEKATMVVASKMDAALPKPPKMPKQGVWPKPGGWIIN